MSIITRTDVTAVKLYQEYILAGIGSFVNVFARRSSKLVQKFQALNGQKIYWFVPNGGKVLVFGGKQFTVISKQSSENGGLFTKEFEAVLSDDWLHSAVWISETEIALLTAHNVVQIWDTLNASLIAEHVSTNNSILYSGYLMLLQDGILVFSGTVFSEVLIHSCGEDQVLQRLKGHKGVIFSVSCDLNKAVIVTTSDDRAVRIWQLANAASSPDTVEYWENVKITCTHELYGHLARVMRHFIKNDFVISIGEDSCICFWDYKGELLKKVSTHQNACVWSLDADDRILVTGGGDSGVNVHPLSVVKEYGHNVVLDIDVGDVKKLVFTARRNVVVMSDKDLVYYNVGTKCTFLYKLGQESSYKFISISPCKEILAVVDIHGKLDVLVEVCTGTPYIQKVVDTQLDLGMILCMQWAGNRHLVLGSENGIITLLASRGNAIKELDNFLLPPNRERWFTSCAIDLNKQLLIIGDRSGNVHLYAIGQKNPIQTFNRVHGRYGPTSITVRRNEIVTTGRDGSVKYFNFDVTANSKVAKFMMCKEIDFPWVEKFIDKNENYICGFLERVFMVMDVRNNSKLFEVCCGGGHRCWDITRYFSKVGNTYEEFVQLVYTKSGKIHLDTFQLSKVASRSVVNGTHAKEINCLKSFICDFDRSTALFISGGEDTTLRISSLNSEKEFRNEVSFKHKSSVRALKLCGLTDNSVLLVSAGGRAQICVKLMQCLHVDNKVKIVIEEITEHFIKGTDKERNGNETWKNCTMKFDPETRIMDVDLFRIDPSNFVIVAGCSDAYLRVFRFTYDGDTAVFKPLQELKHGDSCILKTLAFHHGDRKLLLTCSTKGTATFWDVTTTDVENTQIKPFYTITLHQSGINSVAVKSDEKILICSGGDDNAVQLNLIEITNDLEATVMHTWSSDRIHSSQVTGLALVDDLIITTSIDQRVTLLKWEIHSTGIDCQFVSQVFTDVADVHGLDVVDHNSESIKVCVFGKGFEVMAVPRPAGL